MLRIRCSVAVSGVGVRDVVVGRIVAGCGVGAGIAIAVGRGAAHGGARVRVGILDIASGVVHLVSGVPCVNVVLAAILAIDIAISGGRNVTIRLVSRIGSCAAVSAGGVHALAAGEKTGDHDRCQD